MRAVIGLLLIMTSLLTTLTWAQPRIPINAVVENLGDEPCGLTNDAISGRARLALRQYGFTEAKLSNPYLYINATTIELGQQCIGSIKVEIHGYSAEDFARGGVGWVKKVRSRYTILATTSAVISTSRSRFVSMALDDVEGQIKTALGEIEY